MRARLARSFGLAAVLALPVGASDARAVTPAGAPRHVEVATIPARPEDVSTIDGIVHAYYEVISGPAAQPRQWARDRTLYVPGVRFVEIETKGGTVQAHVWSHQEYVDRTDPSFLSAGFHEREIWRVTERFGSLVNLFSTYESRRTPDGAVIARGVNSLQLFHDGKRWWILGATWQAESPELPIPPEFLPKGPRH